MSIPALVGLLLVVTTLELVAGWTGRASWLPWRRKQGRRGLPASAATLDIFGSVFTDRRAEFEQRQSQSMFRDDEAQGAPPRGRIDLDSGLVRLSPPAKPLSPPTKPLSPPTTPTEQDTPLEQDEPTGKDKPTEPDKSTGKGKPTEQDQL